MLAASNYSIAFNSYAVGGLYPAVDAFFIASIISMALRSGVVFVDLSAPPAPKASDIATALTLSGISAIITKSYSPKLKYASFSLPPTFLLQA